MAVVVFRDKRLDAFEAVRPKSKRKVIVIFRKTRAEKDLEAMEKGPSAEPRQGPSSLTTFQKGAVYMTPQGETMERKKSLVTCPACMKRRHDFRDDEKHNLCSECRQALVVLTKTFKKEEEANASYLDSPEGEELDP